MCGKGKTIIMTFNNETNIANGNGYHTGRLEILLLFYISIPKAKTRLMLTSCILIRQMMFQFF